MVDFCPKCTKKTIKEMNRPTHIQFTKKRLGTSKASIVLFGEIDLLSHDAIFGGIKLCCLFVRYINKILPMKCVCNRILLKYHSNTVK